MLELMYNKEQGKQTELGIHVYYSSNGIIIMGMVSATLKSKSDS